MRVVSRARPYFPFAQKYGLARETSMEGGGGGGGGGGQRK